MRFVENIKMPHRCIAGGCSNTRKDGVSLHQWPDNPKFLRLWTNAVKNTRSDFSNPTKSTKLCSAHFTEDCFEAQTAIAKSLGLKMKTVIKIDAIPTIFKSGPPKNKKPRLEEDNTRVLTPTEKPLRGAYRKREASRVCFKNTD